MRNANRTGGGVAVIRCRCRLGSTHCFCVNGALSSSHRVTSALSYTIPCPLLTGAGAIPGILPATYNNIGRGIPFGPHNK